jgi:hypothetical protein
MRELLFSLLLLLPEAAGAQRVIHRVRFGETLAGISSSYYRTDSYAQLIALANGIDPGRQPKAGEHLRVPTAWVYTAAQASTLEAVAKQLLGDRRRWQTLSVINKLGRRKRVRAGQRIVIPFTIPHTVSPGDQFPDLAKRYYGSPKLGGLIAGYNFILTSQPAPGAQIEIPVGHVRIDPQVLEELLQQRLLGVSPRGEPESREGLQEANALLRRGEYWAVPLRLVQLLAREQSADEHIAEVFKLLAVAYVAVERNDLAVKTFQEALLRQPNLTLDLVTTSPKVARAFFDAKAKLKHGR